MDEPRFIGFDEAMLPTLSSMVRASRAGYGAVTLLAKDDPERGAHRLGSWAKWTWSPTPLRTLILWERCAGGISAAELGQELGIPTVKIADIESGEEKLSYAQYCKILRVVRRLSEKLSFGSGYASSGDPESAARGAGPGAGTPQKEGPGAGDGPGLGPERDAVVRAPVVLPDEGRSGRVLLGVLRGRTAGAGQGAKR